MLLWHFRLWDKTQHEGRLYWLCLLMQCMPAYTQMCIFICFCFLLKRTCTLTKISQECTFQAKWLTTNWNIIKGYENLDHQHYPFVYLKLFTCQIKFRAIAKYFFLNICKTRTHTLWVRGDLRWWVGGGLTTIVYKRDCRRNCWIQGNREDSRKGFVYMYIYITHISHKAMLNLGRAVTEGSCLVSSCPQVFSKNVQLFAVGLLRQWGSPKRLLFSFSGNRVLHVRQKK